MSETDDKVPPTKTEDEAFADEELFQPNGVAQDNQEDNFNATEFQQEMNDKLNEVVDKYTKIAEEWKTGLMNQYLLNEEVSIYDWAQGESRCIVAKDNTPCCTTDKARYFKWLYSDMVKFDSTTKFFPCRKSPIFKEFIMKAEWVTDHGKFKEGDNFCRFISPLDDPVQTDPVEKAGDPISGTEFECPAENRQVCMWDKNNVGCCTENIDLAHSWHDTGCIGTCTWNDPGILEVVAKRGIPFNPSVIYALSDSPGIRNQFNFECPTHHPVPTVAILLGCFIPITIILCAVVGFIHFMGRFKNKPKTDEEEQAAEEEKPE